MNLEFQYLGNDGSIVAIEHLIKSFSQSASGRGHVECINIK